MPSAWVSGNPKEGKALYAGIDKAGRLCGEAGFAPAQPGGF